MATEQRSVIVRYKADASGYNKALRNIDRNTAKAARSLNSLDKQVLSLRSSFNLLGKAAGAYYAALQAAEGARVIADVERLDVAFEAASGSAAAFGRNLEFVRRLANKYGIEQRILLEQFTRFVSAGDVVGLTFEEIARQFEALVTAGTAFGITGAQLEGIILGWQQSLGGATINMEDLRQSVDRIPGGVARAAEAFTEMNDAVEVTPQEFKKLVAEGKIAISFLGDLADALQESTAPLAEAAAQTLTREFDRLKSDILELNRALVELGAADFLKGIVSNIRSGVNSLRQATGQLPSLKEALELDPATASFEEAQRALERLNQKAPEVEESLKKVGAAARNFVVDIFRFGGQAAGVAEKYRRELEQIREQQEALGRVEAEIFQGPPDLRPVEAADAAPDAAAKKLSERFAEVRREGDLLDETMANIREGMQKLDKDADGASRSLKDQIDDFEDLVQYERDYAQALKNVSDPLKDVTDKERALAKAIADGAQARREANQQIDSRISALKRLAETQKRLDTQPRPSAEKARSPQEKAYREIYSDEVNIRNVALKTRELGNAISALPVDEAAAKIDAYIQQLLKLRETATDRWDQLAVEDALRRARALGDEVIRAGLGETVGSERAQAEAGGAAAIPKISEPPELEFTFSEQSIEAGLALIEASSAATPPKISAELDIKFPDVIDLGDFEFQQTIGGQREES